MDAAVAVVTVPVMAVIISLLLGVSVAQAAHRIALNLAANRIVAASWAGGSFVATTTLSLVIEQALNLL